MEEVLALVAMRKFAKKPVSWVWWEQNIQKKIAAASSQNPFFWDHSAYFIFTLKVIMLKRVHPKGKVKGLSGSIQSKDEYLKSSS